AALALAASGSALAVSVAALLAVQQSSGIRAELSGIHGELVRIRQMLEEDAQGDQDESDQTAAPRHADLAYGNQPALGDPHAPLLLVEFTDFQCPFCAHFEVETFPRIKQEYVDTHRLRYVAVDFPLPMHKYALDASQAAQCAQAQGRYWEVREALFHLKGHLERDNLVKLAQLMGLDMGRFLPCLQSQQVREAIKAEMALGYSIGVSGTPTFVVSRTRNGHIESSRMIEGAVSYAVFDEAFKDLLEGP
ncbi:MAG TPA: thioredoxin domain-containing protein, partial [bacterium]|nr:thioredoxin domain-containing protein [bacterium]